MTTRPDTEELASRGKRAEAALQKHLTKLKDREGSFDFQRQYDARSARGRFPAQVGDHLLFRRRPGPNVERQGLLEPTQYVFHGALECKEVHHNFRLPSKNFGAEQIGKLRRREMAGGIVIVAVFHTTNMKWRFPPFSVFRDNPAAASWDLSDFPTYDKPEFGLPFASHEIFG